jgi:hypothetical protein
MGYAGKGLHALWALDLDGRAANEWTMRGPISQRVMPFPDLVLRTSNHRGRGKLSRGSSPNEDGQILDTIACGVFRRQLS